MAYILGDPVLDSHYNNFASQVNSVWGAGTGDSGYGQSTVIPTVSAGQAITAAQWATLLARISTSASHQGSTLTPITTPTVGTPIRALSALQTNITTITTNRRNAAASGSDITAGGVGQRTTGWKNEISMAYTIAFANASAARYFFNAGGQIRMSFSRSGGSAHAKNSDWTSLCSACGTLVMTNGAGASTIAGTTYHGFNRIGGSGVPASLNTSRGYYDLTTVNQLYFRQNSTNVTYLYGGTGNRIQVECRGNTAAPAPVVYVTVRFIDGSPDTSIPSSLDVVDGTLRTTLLLRQPSATHLAASWGSPTISVSVTGS